MQIKRLISKTGAVLLSASVMMYAVSCSAVRESEAVSSEQIVTAEIGVTQIPHRYASSEEARELLLSNEDYYAGFSQNDIDFKMLQTGCTMDDYLEFASMQTLDFTEEQIEYIDGRISVMEDTLAQNGFELPPLDEIVFIKTTMLEEPGAGGYTHGTQIYICDDLLDSFMNDDSDYIQECADEFFWHELFHCLTRCNPDFRETMYSLINFTVADEDFTIPPSVFEYHISNPDVEHHNSYATFIIEGEPVDCFTDFVTTMHYDEAQTDFFDVGTTALIPVDGRDIYYTPEQAANFDEVFGTNTSYVIDPEECMADNFAYAMAYGMKGPTGEGYPNPEIIEGILSYFGASFVG
ncbi:MAG: hypothetical protein K6F79_03545 [Saccharofermentans sp.]|nr:hypothetical protein [Saccharofermentans sp.]